MNIIKIIIGMGFLFFMNVPILLAQLAVVESPLPLDPSIKQGRLANGFTYYIKHIENSSEKINMHLYVKTGYNYQQQDQLEFAHTIEHLAFSCAQNFHLNPVRNPKLLSQLGMNNDDIQGITVSMYTDYRFNIPSGRLDALNTGLIWFHDISNLELTTVKIDRERGAIRQEATSKMGSNLEEWFTKSRMESHLFPFKLDNSNFFEHIQNFSSDSLKMFYKQWYQPDRMGLVIVGDISDIDIVESAIRSRFSDLKGHSKPWTDTRKQYLERPNQFVAIEPNERKPGTTPVEFNLYLRDNKIIERRQTWKSLQRELIWTMLGKLSLLNDRFKEEANSYISSFSAFGSSASPSFPSYSIKVTSNSDQAKEDFQKAIRILHQVKELGFTREEWENAKEEQLIAMQSQDITQSRYWLNQIRNHYVYGIALPQDKLKNLEKWLSGLSLEDFNALIRQYFSDIVNDIGIIVPHGKKSIYTESKVRGWMKEVLEEVPQPYSVPEIPQRLQSSDEFSNLKEVNYRDVNKIVPSPVLNNGSILKKVKPIGVWELVLENGVKVVMDTSVHKNKRVYLHGFSPKGASSLPEADYFSAINAPLIIKNSGVGELDKFDLERFLATTSFWQGAFPYINNKETGITGNADLKDFEKLLQLVYLYFTEPRQDQKAFQDWELKERNRYLVDGKNSFILMDHMAEMRDILGDGRAPKGTRRFHGIAKTSLDSAYSIYTKLYGNAADFTFLISGDFSAKKVLPLLLKYLGNLPHLPETEIPVSTKQNLSKGPLYYQYSPQEMGAFYDMKSIMYSLRFIAPTTTPTDWKEQIMVDALGSFLEAKVQDLRHVKGYALYNMRALGRLNRNLSSYDIEIRLDVVPEELKAVRKACKEMVSEVKNYSYTEARFKKDIQSMVLSKYMARKQSSFQRVRQLHDYYIYNEPWATLSELEIERFIKSLTWEDIQETARKYLKKAYLMEFVMQNKSNNDYP